MKSLSSKTILQMLVVGIASIISTLIAELTMRFVMNASRFTSEPLNILVMSLIGLLVFTIVVTLVVQLFYGRDPQ